MARKEEIIVTLVDDLDGNEIASGAGETIRFGIDGASYEIDLGEKNASAFRALLEPYVSAGRRTARAARGSASRAAASSSSDLAAIRAWAKQNGYTVSDRGRIARSIQDAYHASR